MSDGSRKIIEITEVTGREGSTIQMQPIFVYEQERYDHKENKVIGRHKPTGNVPEFIASLRESGNLRLSDEVFVPMD